MPLRAFDADEAATRLVDEVLAGRELRPATRPPAAGWTLHLEPVSSTYFYHDASTGASAWESPSDLEAAAARPFVRRKGRDPSSAQFWYYKDRSDQKQGPNYPGHMRDWFVAGHFPEVTLVAPSFSGEVPRQADYYQIRGCFEAPLKETAFCWRSGISPYPAASLTQADDEAVDPGKPAEEAHVGWLAEALARPRASNNAAGPVLKGSFCDLHW